MTVIRVLLAGDHPGVRRGMRMFLEREEDIEVVGEAGNGRKALELVQTRPADVLLLDVEMPGLDGLQVAREIHKNQFPIRVLVLSAHEDNQYILGTLANGAAGYLTKDEAPRLLVRAVRRVASGEETLVSKRVHNKISPYVDEIEIAEISY